MATTFAPNVTRPISASLPDPITRPTSSAATCLTAADLGFLLRLQRQSLRYFVENQVSNGLILDRQSNHGPRRAHGLCSTTATGMGFIALALASAPPYRLLSPQSAAQRVRAGLLTLLEWLPHERGVMAHFVDSATNAVRGEDHFSTVETAWLAAGALWASAYLRDAALENLATRLYERIDWSYWTAPHDAAGRGLLRHGKGSDGQFLPCSWDRLNGETVFMYVLGAGAAPDRALPAASWSALRSFPATVAALEFPSADLGLFVFQYGLDLLDLRNWRATGVVDLAEAACLATQANRRVCREAAATFATYRRYWGLSAGDGPGVPPASDTYRCYAPAEPLDGTAHLTATLASVAHDPSAVLENLRQAEKDRELNSWGRYGFSNLNVDRHWVGRDMVGIDVGAAVLALDNYLMHGRLRRVFHELPCVRRGLERCGFTRAAIPPAVASATSESSSVSRAS
jgi:hypothetical protein